MNNIEVKKKNKYLCFAEPYNCNRVGQSQLLRRPKCKALCNRLSLVRFSLLDSVDFDLFALTRARSVQNTPFSVFTTAIETGK